MNGNRVLLILILASVMGDQYLLLRCLSIGALVGITVETWAEYMSSYHERKIKDIET